MLPKVITEYNKLYQASSSKCCWDCKYKNLIILSLGWLLWYSSFTSIKDLASTLHHEDGLGVFCMASFYTGYMVACLLTNNILSYFDTRLGIAIAALFQLPFVLSNALPTFSLMLPLSFLGGFTQAILWTATGSYLVWIANCRGLFASCKDNVNIVFSFFYFVVSCSPVFGGMSTALIFSVYGEEAKTQVKNDTNNINIYSNSSKTSDITSENKSKMCGTNLCFEYHDLRHLEMSVLTRYVIFGFFSACIVLASGMFLCFIDSHKPLPESSTKCPVSAKNLSKIWRNTTFVSAVPMMFYYGIQISFVSGSFYKAYVGCRYGMDKIAYFLIVYGLCSSLSSGLSGPLETFLGREVLLLFAFCLDIVALFGMTIWNWLEIYMMFTFVLCVFWAAAHGIWQTQLNGLVGELFPHASGLAFSWFNFIMSLGLVVGYSYCHFVCVKIQLYATGILCVICTSFFYFSTTFLQRERNTKQHSITDKKESFSVPTLDVRKDSIYAISTISSTNVK